MIRVKHQTADGKQIIHRGRPSFRWFVGGRAHFRVIRNVKNADDEGRLLEAELNFATKDPSVRHRKTPLVADKAPSHLHSYLAKMRADGSGEQQVRLIESRVKRVFSAAGIRVFQDIKPSKIKQAVANMRRRPHNPKTMKEANEKPLSLHTKNGHLQAVQQFVSWMAREERIPRNPLLSLEKWEVKTQLAFPRGRLLPDEFATLIQTTSKSAEIIEEFSGLDRSRLYLIASATGLRRGELASLTARSFDLGKDPVVTVQGGYTKNKLQAVLPLAPSLVAMLQTWLPTLPDRDTPLFPGLKNRKTAKMMKMDLVAAGIPFKNEDGEYRVFHSLRHQFISSLWQTGADAATIMRLARHSDLNLTMRYSHRDRRDETAAIRKLPPLPSLGGGEEGAASA